MKKIICLFICLFIFILDLNAQSFFDELSINKSIFIEQVEERYRWYKLKIINEHYEEEKDYCPNYEEIISDFSEWSVSKPEEKANRVIEEKTEYIDLVNNTYNYILLNNLIIERLILKEIVITTPANVKMPFKIKECIDCVIDDNGYYLLNKNSQILIELENNYIDPPQIEIRYEKDNYILYFEASLFDNKYLVKSIKVRTLGALTRFMSTYYVAYKVHSGLIWTSYDTYSQTYYRYKDTYFRCYDYEKEYLDGYHKEVNGYIKDENTKRYFYSYSEVLNQNCSKVTTFDKNNNIVSPEADSDTIAINYGSKTEKRDYSKLPIYIFVLISILSLLVLVCIKMKKNISDLQ